MLPWARAPRGRPRPPRREVPWPPVEHADQTKCACVPSPTPSPSSFFPFSQKRYHLPTTGAAGPFEGGASFVARPDGSQLAVGLTMESAAYYRTMDDPAFMAHFGIDATYRRSAHVQAMYWGDGYRSAWEARPPLPWASKQPAVAYLSSNCAAPSGRDAIVGRLIEILGQQQANGTTATNDASTTLLRVDGLGACRKSSTAADGYARMQAGELLRTYRFCIAIENSVAPDYVSEKVYAALAAG